MKKTSRLLALVTAIAVIVTLLAACGGSKDAFAGTWKQTSEENGNWTWTFDGSGKCTADNELFTQEGTYSIDEKAGTVTIKLELWSEEIVYTYTLSGTSLKLDSTYSGYDLVKQ